MKLPTIGLAAFLAVGFANTSLAQNRTAAPQVMGSSFGFQLDPAYANATLSISGPNNFHASNYSKGGSPGIDLSQFGALAGIPAVTPSTTTAAPTETSIYAPCSNAKVTPSRRCSPA